jgi:hypothetical protein
LLTACHAMSSTNGRNGTPDENANVVPVPVVSRA